MSCFRTSCPLLSSELTRDYIMMYLFVSAFKGQRKGPPSGRNQSQWSSAHCRCSLCQIYELMTNKERSSLAAAVSYELFSWYCI